MLECHWKSTFGIECPGCGFQRSIQLLLEGNIWESIVQYPATLPLLFTFIYTFLHLFLKFKSGAKIIVISFSITAFLMLANYIYKFFIS